MEEYGVVIGRFQSPFLHRGHKLFLDYVYNKHKGKLVVILGSSVVPYTFDNPLDFRSRYLMIKEEYPEAQIMNVNDNYSDVEWSRQVDLTIYPIESARLYGSRDSFIKHYSGKFPTTEIEPKDIGSSPDYSATEYREWCKNSFPKTMMERAAFISAIENKYPVMYHTVDIAIMNFHVEGQNQILLGRKRGRTDWVIPGGFVDPSDMSLESAAVREAREETGLILNKSLLTYMGSFRIDDWRYRGKDRVMNVLFKTIAPETEPKAGDDLEEVRFFDLNNCPVDKPYESRIQALQRIYNGN